MLVRLTWRSDTGDEVIEEVELLPDDATIMAGDEPLGEISVMDEEGVKTGSLFDIVAKQGFVMFEDEFGIFSLKPEAIINIERLPDED